MAKDPREFWDLLNIPGLRYACYKRACKQATSSARTRKIPIMVRHHGARHGQDDTRVNQYVHVDGRVEIRRDDAGHAIDVS